MKNMKQISASVFLPLCFPVAPLTTHAAGVDGASAGADAITGTAWDKPESVDGTAGTGVSRFCMVVCSGKAGSPAVEENGSGLAYRLAVTNNGVVLGGSDRLFEFEDQSGIGIYIS